MCLINMNETNLLCQLKFQIHHSIPTKILRALHDCCRVCVIHTRRRKQSSSCFLSISGSDDTERQCGWWKYQLQVNITHTVHIILPLSRKFKCRYTLITYNKRSGINACLSRSKITSLHVLH